MDITAKTDFHSHGLNWTQIKAHVDRKHENYSNPNINLKKSDYNYQGYLVDKKSTDNQYWTPFILLQNIRQMSTGHKNDIYLSITDYFKRRHISNQRNSMFEIGNNKTRKKYYRELKKLHPNLTDKNIRKIEADSLFDDIKEYNAHSCQSVGAFSVNCDESTAHIHFQNLSYPNGQKLFNAGGTKAVNLMPRGKKWKRMTRKVLLAWGHLTPKQVDKLMQQKKLIAYKPSASFNNTWRLEFPNATNAKGQFDSRKALHMAHKKYDPMIIRNFNKELQRNGIKDFQLNLVRRPDRINDKNYPDYLNSQKAKDIKKSNESLVANHSSIETSIVNNAEPRISQIISSGKSSANTSASISASNSAKSALKSARTTMTQSNNLWRQQLSEELSTSASTKASKAMSASSVAIIHTKASMIKKYCPIRQNGINATDSQYSDYAKNGIIMPNDYYENNHKVFSSGQRLNTTNLVSYGISNRASRAVSSASLSVASFHTKIRNELDNFNYDYGTNTSQMPDNKAFSTFHKFFTKIKKVTHYVDHMLKKYVLPNRFARKLLRRFINNNDSAYSNDPKDNRPNANNLKDSDVLPQFNYTAETMHNQREANLTKQNEHER